MNNILYFDLGKQQGGSQVEVTLSAATNVQLMDSYNYDQYQHARPYKYCGGFVNVSPYRIDIPNDDHWVVVIDMPPSGKLKHTVKVIPKRLDTR